jgi:ubiquitin-protein ligase
MSKSVPVQKRFLVEIKDLKKDLPEIEIISCDKKVCRFQCLIKYDNTFEIDIELNEDYPFIMPIIHGLNEMTTY